MPFTLVGLLMLVRVPVFDGFGKIPCKPTMCPSHSTLADLKTHLGVLTMYPALANLLRIPIMFFLVLSIDNDIVDVD